MTLGSSAAPIAAAVVSAPVVASSTSARVKAYYPHSWRKVVNSRPRNPSCNKSHVYGRNAGEQISRQDRCVRLHCRSMEESSSNLELERQGGDGGGKSNSSNGGRGNNGSGGQGRYENSKGDGNNRILDIQEVKAFVDEYRIQLPEDMQRKADKGEMPRDILEKYIKFRQKAVLGLLVAAAPALRDRLLADERFFFKINVEIIIDSACATVAEVKQRADMFWKEFDFYASDMIVGIVMDIVLVSLMAPVLRAGIAKQATTSAPGLIQKLNAALAKLPSSCFEKSPTGLSYTLNQRIACYFVKGLQYSLAGLLCGFAGQGIANSLIDLKRYLNPDMEIHVDKPDVLKTALVWGLFMGVSSNTRYMAVNGIERLIESSALAQSVPAVANIGTIIVRLLNNIYGGIQFVDMARYFGVQ